MDKRTRLRLGISTCPNDTYIYENLIKGLPGSEIEWEVFYADVQTLNEKVIEGELDVAKVSCGVLPKILKKYSVLTCGGAMGYGCGPLLLSSNPEGLFLRDTPTALPGPDTTAALLFKFWYSRKFSQRPFTENFLFDELYRKLSAGKIVQGVVIHEHRFTWKQDGLYFIEDLGAYWEAEIQAPIPLGCAVIRKSLAREFQQIVETEIRQSLSLANSRNTKITPFIRSLAQISQNKVIESHIEMFVNHFSENIGKEGKKALETLFQGTITPHTLF